ncbi:MAG TPA: histidine kinase [Ohtaekwangia sp.]|uniref:sensor histidine kinase n=1 Tax=Ohtaekwangia sp. TaxID=2066019 RepID=UPI002F929E5D
MTRNQQYFFWLASSAVIFTSFRWLFGIALPEIALPFSVGITIILVSGALTGRYFVKVAEKTDSLVAPGRLMVALSLFIVIGFVLIAFLLNSMIGETTLFPFAVTVLLLFLVAGATGSLVTVTRFQNRLKLRSAEAAVAQSKSELQLLQSQLSPHFLFNTLNNLYGLSLHKPESLPPLLLKLSELLRYSVYDAKDIFVPLQHEVDYIKNYIDFEKLRLGERLNLKVVIDDRFDDNYKIPPLLLVVFIENAFKHSRTTADQMVTIDISLSRKENSILFEVENSYIESSEQFQKKNSGFGLESVKKRLGLLYAGKHDLHVSKKLNKYTVTLRIDCQ